MSACNAGSGSFSTCSSCGGIQLLQIAGESLTARANGKESSMNADEYLKTRVEDQIKWLSHASGQNQQWFKKLRAAEIVMGCTIAYLVSHADLAPVQFLTGAMGVAVAAISGLLSLYRFQEKWVEYRVTAENLKREKYFFLTGTAPYDGKDKYPTLVSRVEAILAAENMQWAEATAAKHDQAAAGGKGPAVQEPDEAAG
jgi:hypothetical protein